MFEWIKNNKQEIAILSLAVSTFVTGGAISPALEAIRAAFPDSADLAIQMLVSLPPLALVVSGLLAGLFAGRVGKKQLAILGAAIYLVGGLGAGFCNSIATMLVFRLIVGIGAGMLLPLPISLIADFYTGEKRARLTALVAGVASLGGVLMTIAAGLLTTIHWRLVFGVYLIMLPVFLMSLFWLEAPEKNQEKLKLPRHRVVFVISFYMFALNVLLFSMPLYLALHLADLGLGGSLATAMVLVTFNLGGVIMGSIFLPVHKLFGKQTGPAALLMMATGFFMISTGSHLYLMLGGALLFGLGVGVMNSINYLHLINTLPKEDAPMSVAMLNSIMSLGKFVAPLCYGGLGAVGIVNGASSIYAFNGLFVLALAVIFGVKRHYFAGSVDVRQDEPTGHQ